MPYIGSDPSNRFVAPKAASVFSGDGSTTAFTLDHAVGSDEDILVSVDGVIQEPSVAYAVSNGTTLTFTAAPSSNSGNNIFVYYLFRTVGTVSHPSNNALSATNATLTGNATISGTLGVTGAISGTDMQLLHTTTVTSNVDEVQIDGHFTSAFKNYKVIGSNVHLDTDNINFNLKFMSGGSLLTGSVHRSAQVKLLSNNTTVHGIVEGTDTEFAKALGEKVGAITGENVNFEIMLYDPLATDNFKHFRAMTTHNDNSNINRNLMHTGFYNSGQSALSGIEMVPASGNIASGVFKLYGLR